LEPHELEFLIASILTVASFSGRPNPAGADTTVERFRDIVEALRQSGGLPESIVQPHD
jgi:hypothetical protein